MDQTSVFRHQQYELLCSAKALDGGTFTPALVIVKQVWPTRPRQIAVDRCDFPTAAEAIDAAQKRGIEWIGHYG
ncbi:hypothetical protein [Variovorax terrae]|uniref:Uncharacterized protein n=1 Tax=Variovorax terrae TaxID=2923278 RepID=A0A9X1W0D7_9BURK|nr:hypothetical protein [Variovorax terrae]MCJ0765494.1 hypothetical protein [Variovorax terrae]